MDTAVPVILIAVGSFGLAVGLRDLFRARASSEWPIHEGRILAASIKEGRGLGGGACPVVRYEYRHDGVVYEGTRLLFSGGFDLKSSRREVERFLEPLQIGAEIDVHVSPRHPRISVITPGVDRRFVMVICVASWLMLMGVGGLLGWWK